MLYNVKEVSKCLGINIHLVYKKFRGENIRKNKTWAKESVDVKYRKESDSL